nr:MAG TPA: hypothetical protein [Caudoviricetes sp.]
MYQSIAPAYKIWYNKLDLICLKGADIFEKNTPAMDV